VGPIPVLSRYHVQIEVREPGFELRLGGRAEPFIADYDVDADSREQAARSAVARFNHESELSGVGWQRVIERVVIEGLAVPEDAWKMKREAPTARLPRIRREGSEDTETKRLD
jgi:hypothetical protein